MVIVLPVEGDAAYPRYEPIRERFFQGLAEVQSFFDEEKIGSIEPNQCEVSYVNHIDLAEVSDPRSQLHRLFGFWSEFRSQPAESEARLPEFEGGGFTISFIIRDPNSAEPQGRLHMEVQPAFQSEGKSIIRLNLTARGSPASPTYQGVADFLDIGRDAIVRGFAAITTPEMHELWGRIK